MNKLKFLSIILILNFSIICTLRSQVYMDYTSPQRFTIAGISVSGIENLSEQALIVISGLQVGMQIDVPGSQVTKAVDRLWKQGLFSDVQISIVKQLADSIWLDIYLKEQPRLFNVYYYGITKSQETDLREKLELSIGKQVTKNLLKNAEISIQRYFAEKGFPLVEVDFKIIDDSIYQNTVNLSISINKKNKAKIEKIIISGNKNITEKKIKNLMKETKQKNFWRFWKTSKYIEDKFTEDKKKIIEKYKKAGYRDARIIEDSVYVNNNKNLNIYLEIFEGKKYFVRNIEFIGNTKLTTEQLERSLDMKKGDVYDQEKIQKRLYVDETSIGNLYYNSGYLFYQAYAQEFNIENDSIDLRIILNEGEQARINNILFEGNTRTNDYVIRRELKTFPGELFSRDDLVRSVRELANLGSFDPEQLNPIPLPDPYNNSVDIKYKVVERPNDVFELSGGYNIMGFILQVGVTFNNFSMRNILKPKFWDPLPIGDGEKFSIRVNTQGISYQTYSVSYNTPWFGQKKPYNFSVSTYYSHITNASIYNTKVTAYFNTLGTSIGFGKRLKFPDDYFVWNSILSFERYYVKNYNYLLKIGNGQYNVISLTNILSRSSIDNPLYTRSGSDFSISLKTTPPYSLLTNNKSWQPDSDAVRFKFTELFRLDVKGAWYSQFVKDLVFVAKYDFGMTGYYNKLIGYTPFESFDVGGSGFAGGYSYGVDYIALRGYKDHSLANGQSNPAKMYIKYTAEIHYPILLKEMATLYLLGFVEGGNAWFRYQDFNPFDIKRSAGVGARLFVPMLGLVGLDVGYGFDEIKNYKGANKWNFHFTFGQRF